MCNEKVHTNYGAFPVQSRLRAVCGGDTYIGPFYDPTSIANLFLTALAMGQWFAGLLGEWYCEHPMFPADYEARYDQICAGWGQYGVELRRRAEAEGAIVARELGTLPLEEQIRGAAAFTELKGRLGDGG